MKGVSKRAVDGDKNGDFFESTCTETESEVDPWFRVDLEQTISVKSVSVGLEVQGFALIRIQMQNVGGRVRFLLQV